jgi:fructuronate reductase
MRAPEHTADESALPDSTVRHSGSSRATAELLSRDGFPAPPVRIVHLGLGAFHRAHQAWFTHRATDGRDWGIAAFTGRRPDAARTLSQQDGLYTVVERAAERDQLEVIHSISEAHDGADTARLEELLAASTTAVVTITITEAAYDEDGPETPLGRLVRGLHARQASGGGPLAIVSCDNLANNGAATRQAVLRIAESYGILGMPLAQWIRDNVSFVSTSVDRITPRTAVQDVLDVEAQTGYRDNAPVITEPFSSWILAGNFPAGRPAWETAGAEFVDEIEPFENRKLWLLNGAHSLLAYTGLVRGHQTVAEALQDPTCAGAVEDFWDEAQQHLTGPHLDIPAYRAALGERFHNSRIAHRLEQISADGTTKLRMRVAPVLLAERHAGRSGRAAMGVLAAWIDFLDKDRTVQDPAMDGITEARSKQGIERTTALLTLVSPDLGKDPDIVAAVQALLGSHSIPPSRSKLHTDTQNEGVS